MEEDNKGRHVTKQTPKRKIGVFRGIGSTVESSGNGAVDSEKYAPEIDLEYYYSAEVQPHPPTPGRAGSESVNQVVVQAYEVVEREAGNNAAASAKQAGKRRLDKCLPVVDEDVETLETEIPIFSWFDLPTTEATKRPQKEQKKQKFKSRMMIIIIVDGMLLIGTALVLTFMLSPNDYRSQLLEEDPIMMHYRIACHFLNYTNITACQEITTFDTVENNDATNGSIIPSEIGLLTQLSFLRIHEQELTGSFASEIGLLTGLRELSVIGNSLTGSIPREIGQLSELLWLNVAVNDLNGSIDESVLSNMTNLRGLSLSENLFSGIVPASLSNLRKLTWLSLLHIQMTGTIPLELCSYNNITPLVDCDRVKCSCCQGLNASDMLGNCPPDVGLGQ